MTLSTSEIKTPIEFMGLAGSPYTRKMLALLRYRGIPYRMIGGGQGAAANRPQPKVRLLPTFYLPDTDGNTVAVTDSTPLIRRFENEFSGRSVLPADPVVRFLDYLLEDYGDEWLTKCMFHFRWAHQANVEKAGSILPFYGGVDVSNKQIGARRKQIADLQVGRLYVVGSNDTTAPVIEASYSRFLKCFDAHLETVPFAMGGRPGASDFGLYGQLTQLALFDTTSVAITVSEAPRVYGWTENTEDLSGLDVSEGDWITRDTVPNTLRVLFSEVGRVYAPFLLGNAAAVEGGAAQVDCVVDGEKWVQPPFPYQHKCLQWIRAERAALSVADRADLDRLLADTGCEVLF